VAKRVAKHRVKQLKRLQNFTCGMCERTAYKAVRLFENPSTPHVSLWLQMPDSKFYELANLYAKFCGYCY
jgi:hypothetical protein